MAFLQAEDITLPLRFLTLTAHLIATLCIVLDLNRTAARIAVHGDDISEILSVLEPLAYTALVSLIIETIGLFAGATIFNRGLSCLYIFLHFIGTIMVGLFVEQVGQLWGLESYIVIFSLFNVVPCVLELFYGSWFLKGRLMEYRK